MNRWSVYINVQQENQVVEVVPSSVYVIKKRHKINEPNNRQLMSAKRTSSTNGLIEEVSQCWCQSPERMCSTNDPVEDSCLCLNQSPEFDQWPDRGDLSVFKSVIRSRPNQWLDRGDISAGRKRQSVLLECWVRTQNHHVFHRSTLYHMAVVKSKACEVKGGGWKLTKHCRIAHAVMGNGSRDFFVLFLCPANVTPSSRRGSILQKRSCTHFPEL